MRRPASVMWQNGCGVLCCAVELRRTWFVAGLEVALAQGVEAVDQDPGHKGTGIVPAPALHRVLAGG